MSTARSATASPEARPRWRRAAGWVRRNVWRSRIGETLRLPFTLALNNALIAAGFDGAYVRWRHEWKRRAFFGTKSLQENVGFSHREDVDEALRRVHRLLRQTAESEVPPRGRLLDIGSGTGLVARQLVDRWCVVGVDISPALTEAARLAVPQAEFHLGDITRMRLDGNFALAYSIGVVQYIPPGELPIFLARVAALLAPRGVFFLQYPHPVKRLQLWHPNLLSTHHEPRTMKREAEKSFDVIAHHHSFDFTKTVERLDPNPFPRDSFVNGYILIGRKKSAP